MKKFIKSFLITLLVLIIIFVGSIGYFVFKKHGESPTHLINALREPPKSFSFYVLGVDSLDTSNENTRSDTIILVNVNYENNKINLISIPRDTRTNIEGRRYKEKINHAYRYGGTDLSIKTINSLLGIDVPYYINVGYKFVEDAVDAVGGVEIDIPIDMDYEDDQADPPLSIHFKKGLQNLNGADAIRFLRFRHGYANADLDRVQAQRNFVVAFLQKVKSPRGMISIPALMKAYDTNANTNIPFSELARIGINHKKLDFENINSETLPGEPKTINRISYVIYNQKQGDKLLKSIGLK